MNNSIDLKLSEFNSNNSKLLNVEQVKEKMFQLSYFQEELKYKIKRQR